MSKLRMLFSFWLVPYGASTWRRFAYALVVVPMTIVCLPLALAGRGEAAARYQRDLASRLVGTPADEPPRRPTDPVVLAISVGIMAVGVACWLLLWRFTYAILPVPLMASCLALAVAGRAPARFRRRPARGSAGLTVGAPTSRWMGARVAVHAVAIMVVGVVCWTLLSYLVFFALANLGFPFRLAFWINESASGGPPGALGPVVDDPSHPSPRQHLGCHLSHLGRRPDPCRCLGLPRWRVRGDDLPAAGVDDPWADPASGLGDPGPAGQPATSPD